MPRTSPALKAIDAKIALVAKAIEALEHDLRTLRGARSVLTAGRPAPPRTSGPPVTPGVAASPLWLGVVPGSILAATIQVLADAGRPLHVGELLARLHAGGTKADLATVVGALARAVKKGKLRRTAPNTFGLATGKPPTRRPRKRTAARATRRR